MSSSFLEGVPLPGFEKLFSETDPEGEAVAG